MFGWLKNIRSDRQERRTLRTMHVPLHVRGRYDAAATTDENRRHWANADLLSANAANNPQVRRTLRSRARCEVANNSYARGIVLTLANDCVGTGPRLQMLTGEDATNRLIEREFLQWADAISLPEKLRTMRMARCESGEAFCMFVANPKVDSAVKLDLRVIEADQVATPNLIRWFTSAVDGIAFDAFGNPVEYHVLKHHPGEGFSRLSLTTIVFPRQPWSITARIGRARAEAFPRSHQPLPLFAQLRRYTLAVPGAAETAAISRRCFLQTPRPTGEADPVEPMDLVELERRMATVLPEVGSSGKCRPSNLQQPMQSLRKRSSTKSHAA